MIIALWNLATN